MSSLKQLRKLLIRNSWTKPFTWFFLVLYLIGGSSSTHGLVLCFSSDGHVGLEIPHQDVSRCEQSSTGQDSTHTQCSLTPDDPSHPAACYDFVLMGGHSDPTRIERSGSAEQVSQPHVKLIQAQHRMPGLVLNAFQPQHHGWPIPANATHLSIRSTVLLI
jgi:hypothetical protein